MFRLDDQRLKESVKGVDQQPRTTVRHTHGAPRCRNRSVIADGLKQPDLAVADGPPRSEVETQRKPRHAANSSSCARAIRVRFNVEKTGDNHIRVDSLTMYLDKYIAPPQRHRTGCT